MSRPLRLARPARRRTTPPSPSVDLWASPGPFLVRELADAIRCSPRYVEKLIQAGALPAARLGRQLRIPASAARRLALEAGCEANHANTTNGAHQGEPPHAEYGRQPRARRMV